MKPAPPPRPSPDRRSPPRRRRGFLARSLWALGGLPLVVRAASAAEAEASPADAVVPVPVESSESRMALLLGNRSYPQPFVLPPVPKNMRDLHQVLAQRGFDVTNAMDLDLKSSRAALDRFVERAARAPADTTLFFYFVGHGVQVDAANLLLPAGQDPAAQQDALRNGSMQLLGDVVGRLPERRGGMVMAVVDACRTSLRATESESGLNQVEAPRGCLIAFSTGAGKPAIAPAVETQNTFYTASLVRLMGSLPDETSFADMFQLVRTDVRTVMSNFPVEAIRRLAQDPFVADHSGFRLALAPRPSRAAEARRDAFASQEEERAWGRLVATAWPPEVQKSAEAFLSQYPASRYTPAATVARDGSRVANEALRRNDVRIYRAAFQISDDMDGDRREDVLRAGRGDKDAAARMGRRYRDAPKADNAAAARYEGWMQYAAALGNGIAGYELALFYRRQNQPLPASQFEARARELGYTPPPTLDNVRK